MPRKPRKSMAISEDNDLRVQHLRSMFLGSDLHLDIDYTTAVNILLEIGDTAFKRSYSDTITLTLDEIADVLIKNLKKNKLDRDYWKNYLPQLVKK